MVMTTETIVRRFDALNTHIRLMTLGAPEAE